MPLAFIAVMAFWNKLAKSPGAKANHYNKYARGRLHLFIRSDLTQIFSVSAPFSLNSFFFGI